jgi:CO/xanthine dehydrogenase Mo-binding subunit
VTVSYTGTTTPCVTIEDAIAMNRVESPRRAQRGNVAGAFAAAGASHTLEGEIHIAGQYHFYMETQTTVAIPMEDGGLRIITSTQSPSSVQSSVASTVSMPLNKVIVEMKRAGGGYGGKISNATPYACAAAFAAHKHRREVRLVSNIKDNMTSTGKRSPWRFQYRVAFDASGRVTAVSGTVYTANWRATNDFQRCYDIPNWDVSGINCNVEAPPNTWMRSPTELGECTFMNEIMDHVARQLNMPAERSLSLCLSLSLSLCLSLTLCAHTGSALSTWRSLPLAAECRTFRASSRRFSAQPIWTVAVSKWRVSISRTHGGSAASPPSLLSTTLAGAARHRTVPSSMSTRTAPS